MSLIKEGIEKITHSDVTSEEIMRQANLTAEAIRKPKKYWTESDGSELEGEI